MFRSTRATLIPDVRALGTLIRTECLEPLDDIAVAKAGEPPHQLATIRG